MYRYFPKSAMLSQGALLAMNAGADINELDRALKQVEVGADGAPDLGSWYDAFQGLVETLWQQAADDERRGHRLSASHKYRRAAVYAGLAERYVPHTDGRKARCYGQMQASFHKFIELGNEAVRRVEVPYGEQSLPALFIPAAQSEPAPTIVFVDGFDLYKEFVYLRMNSNAARDRGMAMLIVDTPGIGEALRLRGITTRFDTEVPVGACIDYLEGRSDVDADRIGLIGLSLGGYYGTRAAAFEKRVKCCVAWGAMWDAGRQFRVNHTRQEGQGGLSAPATQLLWVTGCDTQDEALEFMSSFTLDGVAEELTVPLLVVHGEADHLVPLEDARRTVEAAKNSPEATLVVTTAEFGGEGHCTMDGMQTGVDLIYDWLADHLAGRADRSSSASSV